MIMTLPPLTFVLLQSCVVGLLLGDSVQAWLGVGQRGIWSKDRGGKWG